MKNVAIPLETAQAIDDALTQEELGTANEYNVVDELIPEHTQQVINRLTQEDCE